MSTENIFKKEDKNIVFSRLAGFYILPLVVVLASCTNLEKEECKTRALSDQEIFDALNVDQKQEHHFAESGYGLEVEYLDCGYKVITKNKDRSALGGIRFFILDEKLRIIHQF